MVPIGYITTMNKKNALIVQRPKRVTARDRLLGAADDLFYRQGIRAVGVDQIVKTAGVAKISMYRAFPSKDDLIVAYLRDRDAAFWREWDIVVAEVDGAEEQLRAVVAFVRAAIVEPGYRGCPFANFTSEYSDRDHAGRRIVEASKGELRRRLSDLCKRMEVLEPERLAGALFILIEGVVSVSQSAPAEMQSADDALAWTIETLLVSQARAT